MRSTRWRAWLVGGAVVVVGFLLRGVPERFREAPAGPEGRAIRVEVLNGSGVTKAGLALAQELRGRGFDVVEIGNATERHERTVVIDRVGDPRWAEAVARALDAGPPVRQRNPDLLVEVTVVLGQDRGERYGRER